MPSRPLPLAVLLLALAACKNPQPCPTPLEECSGSCVDIQSDRRFCGGCGTACPAGDACVAGHCRLDVRGPCPRRAGGGFVTLGFPNGAPACGGQVVKLWIQAPDFLDAAVTYVGSTVLDRVPVLDVVPGADCDAQWSWNVDELTPEFAVTAADAACDLCPAAVQASYPRLPRWCPSGARVLAVDRPAPP
jgi:hypothetical protein